MRFSPAKSLSLTIERSLPSPVTFELMTNLAPPSAVPVLIILAVIPKLPSALLICSRSCARVAPAVTSIEKVSPVPPILKVNEPAVSVTWSLAAAKPPFAAVADSMRLPLAKRSTVIAYSPVKALFAASALKGSVSSDGLRIVGSRPDRA